MTEIWAPGRGGGCDPRYSDLAHNIKIQHYDGSIAQYVHVNARVKVNDIVAQGALIAVTAENGWICRPQLHFGLYRSLHHLYDSESRETLPLRFYGVEPDGLAREGLRIVTPPNDGRPLPGTFPGME